MQVSKVDRIQRGRRLGFVRFVAMIGLVLGMTAAPPSYASVAGKPGDLMEATPVSGAPEGALAFSIRYRSLDEKGAPTEVTGIAIVPAGPPPTGGRDIVSWGRGTVGLAPVCAPSKTPKVMFEKTPGISDMLRQGFAIVASDFADPDSSRAHPYLVGTAEAHAMLDAVRALTHLRAAATGKRYALWGESEGAHAALWAAKLAPDYAPDIDLVGVAAAAPPTDLIANFDEIKNPLVRALMTGYVSDSWSKVYGIPLSTFANPLGRLMIRQLAKDCTRFDVASAFANVSLLLLSHSVPHDLGKPWTRPLEENSLKPWHLAVPMLIAQGGKDDVVVPTLTREFAAGSCRIGDDVRWLFLPDAAHLTISTESTQATVAWIADRFAGKPSQSNCGVLLREASSETGKVAD